MTLVDLTLETEATQDATPTVVARELTIEPEVRPAYVARVYDFAYNGMIGTYIDFPGHVVTTDDGEDAATWPLRWLYRVPTQVVHLDKKSGEGAVGLDEVEAAGIVLQEEGALIVNALGAQPFDAIESRSVFLGDDLVDWIADSGIRLLVSDIYESAALHGVFERLFAGGIATVCCPVNLHRVTGTRALVTVLPARFRGVTQLPCRVVAEIPESSPEEDPS